MGHVIASAPMSLDDKIAEHGNAIAGLFDLLQNGEVGFDTVDHRIRFRLSPPSAEYWQAWVDGLGALGWPVAMTDSGLASSEQSR